MTIFAERLRESREKKGFTQKQVAEALGFDLRNYCRYERAESEPVFSRAALLAEFFDVSLDYLAGRD